MKQRFDALIDDLMNAGFFLEQTVETHPGITGLRAVLGIAYCDADRLEMAAPILRHEVDTRFAEHSINPTWLMAMSLIASLCIELADTDGPYFAVQMCGDLDADTTVTGQIQQSTDGTTWFSITGGAFTAVTDSENVQVIRFTPTLRYVRWIATIAGGMTPSAAVAVVIGRQKKTF